MEALFGQGKTPAQRMKDYQRQIKKSVREMDRERSTLERQEKKLLTNIKKEAKAMRRELAKELKSLALDLEVALKITDEDGAEVRRSGSKAFMLKLATE